jgi:voltage-gated potassium channel
MAQARLRVRNFFSLALWVEGGMIFLALVSGYLLFLEFTTNLTDSQLQFFDTIDLVIALTFLCEFAVRFYIAKKRRKFFKLHWWELLAAIPITTPLTQALRLLRLLRLLHLAQSVTD